VKSDSVPVASPEQVEEASPETPILEDSAPAEGDNPAPPQESTETGDAGVSEPDLPQTDESIEVMAEETVVVDVSMRDHPNHTSVVCSSGVRDLWLTTYRLRRTSRLKLKRPKLVKT
jgi:hypothetical protein